MKIRQGFVSNSSSSSFVAVLTRDKDTINKFLEKCGITRDDIGDIQYDGHSDFEDVNYGVLEHKPSGLQAYCCCGEIYWVGLDVFNMLNKDMRVSECKVRVKNMFEKFGVKVNEKDLHLDCDECSSE